MKTKQYDLGPALICECGEIRPMRPTFPRFLMAEILHGSWTTCDECGKEMRAAQGLWQYYDKKTGIWPFRKTERHWQFKETK